MSAREILDIVEGEWGTFETANVDVTELHANAQVRMDKVSVVGTTSSLVRLLW